MQKKSQKTNFLTTVVLEGSKIMQDVVRELAKDGVMPPFMAKMKGGPKK